MASSREEGSSSSSTSNNRRLRAAGSLQDSSEWDAVGQQHNSDRHTLRPFTACLHRHLLAPSASRSTPFRPLVISAHLHHQMPGSASIPSVVLAPALVQICRSPLPSVPLIGRHRRRYRLRPILPSASTIGHQPSSVTRLLMRYIAAVRTPSSQVSVLQNPNSALAHWPHNRASSAILSQDAPAVPDATSHVVHLSTLLFTLVTCLLLAFPTPTPSLEYPPPPTSPILVPPLPWSPVPTSRVV